MRSLTKYGFYTLLAIVAIVSSWYSWMRLHTSETKETTSQNADAFMTQVSAVQFNEIGGINYTLTTPKLTHYPTNNTTQMTTPFITIPPQTQNHIWEISAKHGQLTNGTQAMLLQNHVTIIEHNQNHRKNATIRTEQAYYYPKKTYARSDKKVTLSQPNLSVSAVGVEVYFNDNSVKLLSDIRGEFDQSRNKERVN